MNGNPGSIEKSEQSRHFLFFGYGGIMTRHFTLMLSLLLLALICLPSTSRAQFMPVAELGKEKLSSRPSPAQVAKESADALKAKGYVMIGEIFLKNDGKSCWGPKCATSISCPSGSIKKDLTKELLKKAASKGGDFVILSVDNATAKESISKNGKCIVKDSITRLATYQKCQSAGRDSTGTYRTGTCTTETKEMTFKQCTTWETIGGNICRERSSGTVWRLDPELGKRIAAKIVAEAAKIAEKNRVINLRMKAAAFISENRLDPSDLTPVYENGKYGYGDRNGNILIPAQFDIAPRPFVEGLARVRIGTKYGFIDKKGAFVINGQFDAAEDFSQGFSAVGIGPSKPKYKYGYIDTKGEFVIPVQFDDGRRFSEGLAAVAVEKMLKPFRCWGYIDKAGKLVVSPGFYDAKEFSEGLAPVASGKILTKKWGYINKDGAEIIKPTFDDALGFSEGLAAIAVGILIAEKKWGYINKDGQIVIQPSFNEAASFSEGLAKVKVADKYGYIDKSGTFVIKPQFEKASSFSNNEARVIVDGAQAFIDKSGKVAIQSK
jgi:hypothetical protein